ncbi:unnamed protein product [Nyctereutes procyonoides]|uniref:(raccoon dog) hypothetical protein n=1 Tax=Nyctereutes procyonoides TaxID=34880 RepID=A0A811Z0M8_NYCPR|nr:unnamed protein product [Nyctereutes procyonoides]
MGKKNHFNSYLGFIKFWPLFGFSFSSGNSSLFGIDIVQNKPISSPFSTKTLEIQAEGRSNEYRAVIEVKEDTFYSKESKLFYKKEKGVGTLYLKPTVKMPGWFKTLLNVIPPNMPCIQTRKNNMLIVCVPHPHINEKDAIIPVTILVWVKIDEDAAKLHKILLEKKDV